MTRIQIRLNNSDPDLQHFILMIEWCREEMLCPQPVPLPDIPHDSQVTFEVSLPIILWTRAVDPHSFSADPDLVFFSQWRIQMRIRSELYKTAVSVKTFTLGRVCFDWHLHQCRHWVSAHIINWFFFKIYKITFINNVHAFFPPGAVSAFQMRIRIQEGNINADPWGSGSTALLWRDIGTIHYREK